MKVGIGVVLKQNERNPIEVLESEVPHVDFCFRNLNGEHRNARGTRNLKYVPR